MFVIVGRQSSICSKAFACDHARDNFFHGIFMKVSQFEARSYLVKTRTVGLKTKINVWRPHYYNNLKNCQNIHFDDIKFKTWPQEVKIHVTRSNYRKILWFFFKAFFFIGQVCKANKYANHTVNLNKCAKYKCAKDNTSVQSIT